MTPSHTVLALDGDEAPFIQPTLQRAIARSDVNQAASKKRDPAAFPASAR